MKKATLTILLIAFAMIGFAQRDTTKRSGKQDTAFIKVPVYERYDTAIVRVILYGGQDGNVKYFSPGYIILKGYAIQNADKKWQWTEQPKTDAALDNKKQRLDLKKVLQLIQ